jgi:signal transduction histidine kinase
LRLETNRDGPFARHLAARILEAREELTRRWLDRIVARVSLDPHRVFPSEELLDHVPVLMDGIAAYVSDPAEEISADAPVIAKARELGELRFSQGFDAHEILREYEILGGVLFAFASEVADADPARCAAGDLLSTAHRLSRAISVVEQATTSHYLRVLGERVSEREEQLRRFNRMISHELKNRVGAVLGAGQLLQEDWLSGDDTRKFASIVADNAQEIQAVLSNLTTLSQLDGDARQQRNIRLPQAVAEVFRQLRDLASARGVQLVAAEGLPDVEVSAAAVELCLSNYVSNAIKYADPDSPTRRVDVSAAMEQSEGGADLVVRVRDNGRGVPAAERPHLFDRFFRGSGADVAEGTGLGLNIVKETIESLGGRAWAEFDEDLPGSVFAFSLPSRRRDESRIGAEDVLSGEATRAAFRTHG